MKWSLEDLLSKMHDGIHRRLEDISAVSGHPGTMGDASEGLWLEFLQAYLPERYRVGKAFVVDSSGHFSEQIDVVVFDRQYTPFIFNVDGIIIVPIESVYAVFECKQVMNAEQLKYAGKKIGSVRKLTGTSLPIPNAGKIFPAKPSIRIIGGFLDLRSSWSPPLRIPGYPAGHSDDIRPPKPGYPATLV